MNRYRVLIVTLAAMALIAGCTSSDDAADETTTAPPTTVAPPETATTAASTTSTTLSPAAAIATAEALHEAISASDPDTALSLFADVASWDGATPGSPEWEKRFVEFEEWGRQSTLSDCEATDGTLTCLDTWERTNLSGRAGVIRVSEWEYRFDDKGLIANAFHGYVSGRHNDYAFEAALGRWMATAHPESYETFYNTVNVTDGKPHIDEENWLGRVAELSPLIDEFVAQSDEYPLSG